SHVFCIICGYLHFRLHRLRGYSEVILVETSLRRYCKEVLLACIVLGYDGLPIQPVAPPSPDYIPDSEEPQTPPVPQDEDEREPMFIQPHDPDYVPEPIYPEDEEDKEGRRRST
ncbi:hypothetical protein Tco_0852408, partial [Tanacetum coccineum]